MEQLPLSIANSTILDALEKELLRSVDTMPVIDAAFDDNNLKQIVQYYALNPEDMELELHRYAKILLQQEKIAAAWQVLLSGNIF